MARDKSSKSLQMRARIAATAARIMAEDGVDDFAAAKRKAARMLGATDTESLPGNDEVEAELKTYMALYKRDEHAERLRELRGTALDLMCELAPFKPYLVGPVLKGTAGRYADIDLHVFTDDPKAIEFFLLDRGIEFAVDEQRFYCGDEVRAVPALALEWDGIPVRIAVGTPYDERANLKTSLAGRPIERANPSTVAELLVSAAADTSWPDADH